MKGLQKWDDQYVRPAYGLDKCTYSFMTFADFQAGKGAGAWPLFLNNHSVDPGILGFHDGRDEFGVYGRMFIGDCIRYGVSATVGLSHEAAEMRWNPRVDKFHRLPDGRWATAELCDAVSGDENAIAVGYMLFSDIVLPDYWSVKRRGKFDVMGKLNGPCPTVTPGGYQSIWDGTAWHQINARYLGGPSAYRSARFDNSLRGRALLAVPHDKITAGSSPP